MNLKKKTLLAITVKLLFSVTCLQAQSSTDSVKQKPVSFLPVYTNFALIKQPVLPNQLPGNFYATQLPFFCTKELQVQKVVGIPIKFRVGSVEYCDKLEGKNR
jgi:hypothetical protein